MNSDNSTVFTDAYKRQINGIDSPKSFNVNTERNRKC